MPLPWQTDNRPEAYRKLSRKGLCAVVYYEAGQWYQFIFHIRQYYFAFSCIFYYFLSMKRPFSLSLWCLGSSNNTVSDVTIRNNLVTRYKCSIAHKWEDMRSASGSCHTWHTLVGWAWVALHKPKCGQSHFIPYIHFITQIANVQSTKGFSCVIRWTRLSCQNHHTLHSFGDNIEKALLSY